MAGEGWCPPPSDVDLGLRFYASRTAGVGGRLKRTSDAFRVQEVSKYPTPDPAGEFTVLRVESHDWEQHELAERIASHLRLPLHSVDYAGTKDRRAYAERLFSYRGRPPTDGLSIPRVKLEEVYRARTGLALGHHYGNRFDIVLDSMDLPEPSARERVETIQSELAQLGGVPNLFGPQRFGEVRPVTHCVGRQLVRSDAAAAVETYLAEPSSDPHGEGETARSSYAKHHDPCQALKEFPAAFRFERILLDHLARGQSPSRALTALSRGLRTLFIHAYQSLLFNRYLSIRWEAGLSLLIPEPGDWLVRIGTDGSPILRSPIPVESDNLAESRAVCERGGARVAGPLIGYATPALGGRPGDCLDSILEEEGVHRKDFEMYATPDIASAGTFRPLAFPKPPLRVRTVQPASTEAAPQFGFSFTLPKGAYATVLMREFTKTGSSPRPAEES